MSRTQIWRRLRKSNRTWDSPWLPALSGVFGGLFLALALTEVERTARGLAAFVRADSWAFLWAFLFGFLVVALPVLLIQKTAQRLLAEVRAMLNVRPLTGSRMLGNEPWAMDAVYAEHILGLVDEGMERVVELGSGESTLLVARHLEERGAGHVTAVDHLEEFADRTRRWIREAGLEHRARVIHAPIASMALSGRTVEWYDPAVLAGALDDEIDLLLVDGPPDILGPDARWPAVPFLADRLAPTAAILMDDGDRKAETRAALDWHDRLGGRIRYVPGGKGAWILRVGS